MLAALGKQLTRPTILAAIVLVGLGLVFAIGGVRLGLWVDGGPGPGLLPTIAATLLLLLVAVLLVSAPKDEERFHYEPLLAMMLCCAYAAIVPRIGVLIPTFALIVIWVMVLHRQTLLRASLLGVGLTGAGVVLFHVLLKVPMQLIAGVL